MSGKPTVDELLALQGDNEPEAFDGHAPGPGGTITKKEAAERRVFLARLITSHYDSDSIYVGMAKQFGMSQESVDRLELEIYRIWEDEDSRRSNYWKSAAIRRIMDHIRSAAKEGSWSAVGALEKIAASIQGTNAPIEVHSRATVTHATAVLNLIGEMPDDEVRALIEAEHALAQKNDVIDVTPAPEAQPESEQE